MTGQPLFSEIEAELFNHTPVVAHDGAYRRLCALGAHRGISRNGDDALCVADVVDVAPGRFEFPGNVPGFGRWRPAILVPARDECGDLADIAALSLDSGDVVLWRGTIAVLGQENVLASRLNEALVVHETVADWLRAGREGVFVIDAKRAAPLLHAAAPLGVERPAFGRQLRESLTIRAPQIKVATIRRAAA
jgi:hypothetical protein